MRRLKNNSGFTLIEVMIAIGLMGAISVWMMDIFKQQTKNAKTTSTNMDIDSIGQEIRNIFADGRSCEKSLKGISTNKRSAITEIKKYLSDGTLQNRFKVNDSKIGNSSVAISGYDLKTDDVYLVPTGQKYGETVLIINYNRGKMIQGSTHKSFRIPLSVTLDAFGNILNCHALASTTNLESLCNAIGRGVDSLNKKCSPPMIYLKGDTPIHQKQYEPCEGGRGAGEHILDSWTANGNGTAKLSWSGLASGNQITWKVYKNNVVISSNITSGNSFEVKEEEVELNRGDVFKHSVVFRGGSDDDCVSAGSFSVGLDLLNML